LKLEPAPIAEHRRKVESSIFAPRQSNGVTLIPKPTTKLIDPEAARIPYIMFPSDSRFSPFGAVPPKAPPAAATKNGVSPRMPARAAAAAAAEPSPEEVVNRFTLEVHDFLVECQGFSASIFTLKGIFGDAVNSSPYLTPLIFKKVLKELAVYNRDSKSWILKEQWRPKK